MKRKPPVIKVRPCQAYIITSKTPVGKIIRMIQVNSQRCVLDFSR